MTVPPGTRIGAYEITGLLGEGGMGQVYRATDTALHRNVAIKILPDAFKSDPERLARFEREARTLASLSHPHIAAVYGLERTDGSNAIVMELVEGEDLSRVIARGPIPVDEALAIASQIAEALEAAHEQGIIHRDLKPANIKVKPDGSIKVLDFGLAKAVSGDGSRESGVDAANSPTLSVQATAAGMILGTAAYMSPEQARGRVTDKRTDVWAFGCVLYEMLSGMRAFEGDDATDIIAAVVRATPDWSALPPTVPPRIVALIKRCLEKDRKQRASDIAVARFVIGGDGPIEASSTSTKARPSRVVATVAAVASIAAFAMAWPTWTHLREQPKPLKVVRFQLSVPGDLQNVARLSPDGKFLAVLARPANSPGNQAQIWLQSLDSGEAHPVVGTEGAVDPFWSPDSRFIGFGASLAIHKVSVSGGGVQEVCKLTRSFRGASWSSSGDIVFGTFGAGLMRVPQTGGTPSPVTILSAEQNESYHHSPWFLPDGRHFVYSRSAALPGVAESGLGVYAGSLDTAPEQQPLEPLVGGAYSGVYAPSLSSSDGWLLFIRDGTLLAQPMDPGRLQVSGEPQVLAEGFPPVPGIRLFSVSTDGVLALRANAAATQDNQLAWFDRAGKRLGNVGDPGPFNSVSLSPDGTKAVVSRNDRRTATSDLWVFDLVRGGSSRFTSDPGNDWLGVWSPNGRDIAFSSNRGGNKFGLYVKPSNGAVQETLLASTPQGEYYAQDFSPDGSVLLLSSTKTTSGRGFDIEALDLKTRKAAPFIATEFAESQPRFSPDGRYVAYNSNASGRPETYVQPYPDVAGGKWTISVTGGTQPRWRKDGRELFFISADSQMMAVDVNTAKGFVAGVPKMLFPTNIWGGSIPNNVDRYDVTADGQRFLINLDTSGGTPLGVNVVLNWEASLKR